MYNSPVAAASRYAQLRNPFKLGIFATNCSSGLAATRIPERWQASWANNVAIARMADEAGIDFLLPLARWKGYPGPSDFEGTSFEALTWAGGMLAHTRSITVFATIHVPLLHPIYAAKQMATVDHIGGGRFGLNIVCGWNADEFEMFGVGQREHDDRYAYGDEWWNVVRRVWTSETPFDVRGTYFTLNGVIGKPGPWGGTTPIAMNAAGSPAGRAFAVRNCDVLFTFISDLDRARRDVETIVASAREVGRRVDVYTTSYVVCRPTRKEAEEFHRYYVDENGDWEAADHWFQMQAANAKTRTAELRDLMIYRFAGGHGCYPLIGSADDVAKQIADMAAAGFAGTTLAFVDYVAEFPFFAAEILPRLERMGLRLPAGSGAIGAAS
jgi:alkanesulfonate monooxygenase SsuD/methylene tetrahydromethanopterin reductase-like flavin-dependent oxidoreductase (luciferase family)